MTEDNSTPTGRKPLYGTRLPNPRHVRFTELTERIAQQIADDKYGGNISRALRLLAEIGATAWESQQHEPTQS